MSTPSLAFTPAHELADKISKRQIRSFYVVLECLDRIRAYNLRLNAFADVYEQKELAAAEAADKAISAGYAVGPLHGLPIALKDVIDIEGEVTRAGSAVWRRRQAAETATLGKQLISQGMIVIGKTQTVEFAMGSWGTNRHLGTPRNP